MPKSVVSDLRIEFGAQSSNGQTNLIEVHCLESHLPFATFAYNTAVYNTLQISPFFMSFLKEPTIFVDWALQTFSLPPVAAKYHSQMENIKVAVQARTEDQHDYSVSYHNKFSREVTYEPWDLVLLHISGAEVGSTK